MNHPAPVWACHGGVIVVLVVVMVLVVFRPRHGSLKQNGDTQGSQTPED